MIHPYDLPEYAELSSRQAARDGNRRRQAKLRAARKVWLKEHGFNSPEAILGALVRGEYKLVKIEIGGKNE